MTANPDSSKLHSLMRGAAVAGLCLLLAGCPSASNPTQPQSQPPSPSAPGAATPPPSASGSPGTPSTPSGSPSAPSPSNTGGSEGGSPPTAGRASSAGAPSSTSGDQPAGDSSEGDIASRDQRGSDGSDSSTDAGVEGQAGADPGFGDSPAAATASLPDMRDTPTMDSSVLAALEEAMGAAAGEGARSEGSGDADSSEAGTDAAAGNLPGTAGGPGNGPLTPAEQVAILDARLESSAGDFDGMILEEQARQRSARRQSTRPDTAEAEETVGAGSDREGPYGEEVAATGSYGGGGMGSVRTPGGAPPANPAKYPPPADIPSGNDDDVVARQLREAAMREPDPAIREKLWDEYRKYKGIKP